MFKGKKLLMISFFAYLILDVVLLALMYKDFGVYYTRCVHADLMPALQIVMFVYFCLFYAFPHIVVFTEIKEATKDNDVVEAFSDMSFGMIPAVILLLWFNGRKWVANIVSRVILYFPAYIVLWMIDKNFFKQNIIAMIIEVVIALVVIVIAFGLELVLMSFITNPAMLRFFYDSTSGAPSKSSSSSSSSSLSMVDVLDAVDDYERRRDLRRAADALEDIRHDLHR